MTSSVKKNREGAISAEDQEKTSLNSNIDDAIAPYLKFFSSKPFNRYKEFLHARFLYLTGARECGHPVLIVDVQALKVSGLHNHPNLHNFISTFMHLCSEEYIDVGIFTILDLRSGGTTAAKNLLNLIKNTNLFPVHEAIVLKSKASTFSNTPTIIGAAKIKYLKDLSALSLYIMPNNLTTFLGGSLNFDYDHWLLIIQLFQDNMEKTSSLITSMESLVTEIASLDYDTGALINTSPSMMTKHFALMQELTHGFMDVTYGLSEFSNLLEKITLDQSPISCTPGFWDLFCKIESLRKTVKNEDSHFQEVFRVHQDRMRNCVKACELKLLVLSVNSDAESGLKELHEFKAKIPFAFDEARQLGEDFEKVSTVINEKLEHEILAIEREAEYLISRELHCEYFIKHFDQLKKNFTLLQSLIQELSSQFMEFTDYYCRAQVIEEWCQHLKCMLANTSSSETSSKSYVKKLNKWIHDIQGMMGDRLTKQVEALSGSYAKEHYKRLKEEVDTILSELEQRKNGIEAAIKTRSGGGSNFLDKILKPGARKNDKGPDKLGSLELSQPTQSQISNINPSESLSSLTLLASDEEKEKKVLVQRQFIFKEIIETERTYCEDLKYIITNFVNDQSEKCPDSVVKHGTVIFSNIEELYAFHNDIFLEELRKFMDAPQNIGILVVKQKYNFQLYSTYCKNRPQCENFLSQHPELLDYFQQKQLSLGNKLPFLSYLIKPIQRITKYQLLLRDMLKNSQKAPDAHAYLQEAIECMLKILKNLNDTLYINAIKHFPGNILEQGQLLHQDELKVKLILNKAKLGIGKVRANNQQVFLFEKSIVFTKKQKLSQNLNDLTHDHIYLYKTHIMTSDLILRENLPGNPSAFEVIVHKQNCSYILAFPDLDTQTKWLQSINVLLQLQFSKMRELAIHKTGVTGPQGLSKAVVEHGMVKLESTLSETPPSPSRSLSNMDGDDFRQASSEAPQSRIKHKSAIHPKSRRNIKSAMIQPESFTSCTIAGAVLDTQVTAPADTKPECASDASSSEDEGRLSLAQGLQKPLFAEEENLLVGSMRTYRIQKDYKPDTSNPHGIRVKAGQSVMVLGLRPNGLWWVRTLPPSPMVEGWLPQDVLNPSISPGHKLI